MLAASLAITPFAVMSRPAAGVRNNTLIITLPGSPRGAEENLRSVIKVLPHACHQATGMDSRVLHSGGIRKLEQSAGLEAGAIALSTDPHRHDRHGHCQIYDHDCDHGVSAKLGFHSSEGGPISNGPNEGPTRRHRESPYPMLSVDKALNEILRHTPEPSVAPAQVDQNLVGSVLAQHVVAGTSVPAFRASIVDGYAIMVPERTASAFQSVLSVVGVSHAQAGHSNTDELRVGEAMRITTGAPLPPGATSVVMVEDTLLVSTSVDGEEEKEIKVLTADISHGENVRGIGSDIEAGDLIMRRGERVTATGGELGLLASIGVQEVAVFREPVVGVLSTGNEIVPHQRAGDLRHGEVRDTNRPTLIAAVRNSGFEVVDLGIVSDQSGTLEQTLRAAMRLVDVIVTSGGVSMGELDLLKPTIERQLGGIVHFGRVNMKPGKPTTFSTVPFESRSGERVEKVFFSLPGNPASAVTGYHLFVLPSLHKMSGINPAGLQKLQVVLEHEFRCDIRRPEYHRVLIVMNADGRLSATSTGGQRSSRIGSFKGANGLLCLPTTQQTLSKGETCDALLIGELVALSHA